MLPIRRAAHGVAELHITHHVPDGKVEQLVCAAHHLQLATHDEPEKRRVVALPVQHLLITQVDARAGGAQLCQLTLLQAIALSGGPTDNADPRRVIIFRQIEGKRNAAGFDLRAIREGKAEDPVVYGNDIVVVDGSEARRRYGEFLRSVPLLALFLIY